MYDDITFSGDKRRKVAVHNSGRSSESPNDSLATYSSLWWASRPGVDKTIKLSEAETDRHSTVPLTCSDQEN